MLSDHASTIDGIPLIGISPSATRERCDACGKVYFLADIELIGNQLLCKQCNFAGNQQARVSTEIQSGASEAASRNANRRTQNNGTARETKLAGINRRLKTL